MSIPTNGPAFRFEIPRINPNGIILSDAAIEKLGNRLERGHITACELNHPIRESQMSDEEWMVRFMGVHETRAVARIMSVERTHDFMIVTVKPVGNNRELFEGGEYTMAPRVVAALPDSCGRRYTDLIVTVDMVVRNKEDRPTMCALVMTAAETFEKEVHGV